MGANLASVLHVIKDGFEQEIGFFFLLLRMLSVWTAATLILGATDWPRGPNVRHPSHNFENDVATRRQGSFKRKKLHIGGCNQLFFYDGSGLIQFLFAFREEVALFFRGQKRWVVYARIILYGGLLRDKHLLFLICEVWWPCLVTHTHTREITPLCRVSHSGSSACYKTRARP